MKDTLEFTAAFIITTKVYRDVLTTVGHVYSGTRRNTPAKAKSSDNKDTVKATEAKMD